SSDGRDAAPKGTRTPMKRAFTRTSFFGAAAAYGVAGSQTCRAADSYTLRLSTVEAAGSVQGTVATHYAEAVRNRSKGQLKIEVYPSGQLASQQETIDALGSGVVDLTIQGTGILQPPFPRYQVFDMPFLFKDAPAAFRVLDGPVGVDFFTEL